MTTRAMLLAGDVLFVTGNPIHDKLKYNHKDPLEEVSIYESAYKGELGGIMRAVSKKDGSTLADYNLDSPIRWDGLAAADGKLFMSMEDGNVMCWKE